MSESYIKGSDYRYCGTCQADRIHVDTGQRRSGKVVMLCTKCFRRSFVARELGCVERVAGNSEGVATR